MIWLSVLRAELSIRVIPVIEDDHSRHWFIVSVNPLAAFFVPVHADNAANCSGHDSVIQISAFIAAPTHKAGTPFNTTVKAHPTPVRLTAHVAELRSRHIDNIMVQNDVLDTAKMEGRAEGIQDGKKTVARNLKAMGMDIEAIAKATGLGTEEIIGL